MTISWLGVERRVGGVRIAFPKCARKKKKEKAARKSFSDKDMMGVYLLSNLPGM